jgi:hypothetical protein
MLQQSRYKINNLNALFAFMLVFALLSASHIRTDAQELKATVSVDVQGLPADQRDDIVTLQQDVLRYLNTQSFTGKEFKTDFVPNVAAQDRVRWKDEPVEVDVSITVTGRSGFEYTGQLLLSARRTIYGGKGAKTVTFVTFDKAWKFEYRRNSEFSFNLYRYESFASTLDFYVLVALGMDLDSYYELGGTQLYRLAQQIWQNGNGQNAVGFETPKPSEIGNLSKGGLMTELNDVRYDAFRKLILAYHVSGLDYLNEDKPKALKAMQDGIVEMANFKEKLPGRSTFMQYFFDAKFRELCDLFRKTDYAEKVFTNLKFVDISHGTAYENALAGREQR